MNGGKIHFIQKRYRIFIVRDIFMDSSCCCCSFVELAFDGSTEYYSSPKRKMEANENER